MYPSGHLVVRTVQGCFAITLWSRHFARVLEYVLSNTDFAIHRRLSFRLWIWAWAFHLKRRDRTLISSAIERYEQVHPVDKEQDAPDAREKRSEEKQGKAATTK